MAKIWLKSVDPSKQCCGCEGKAGPCDSCCSFDLTDFEGRQANNSAADQIFSDKTIQCRAYFPEEEIKNQSSLGRENDPNRLNIIMSANYDSTAGGSKTFIDANKIELLHTDGYTKNSNGQVIISTESKIIDSSKKIAPPREDFCSENRVEYRINPPIEYDMEISSTVNQGEYAFSDGAKEEIDAPESDILGFNTEENYSEISKGIKITNEICCNGTKYKFTQLFASTSEATICKNKGVGVYRQYTWTRNFGAFGFSARSRITIGNLRFNQNISRWQLDWSALITITEVSAGNVTSSLATRIDLPNAFVGIGIGIGPGVPVGATNSNSGTVSVGVFGQAFNIPMPATLVYDEFDLSNNSVVYILPNCESIISNSIPEVNDIGSIPECSPYYACIKKDNIVKTQELLTGGIGGNAECESGATSQEDFSNQVSNAISSNPSITPNLLGIIATSLSSLYLAGGVAASAAAMVTLGTLGIGGLVLAAGLIYYSIKQGAPNSDSGSYQNEIQSGQENPSCDTIGEGNILKTTEEYSVVGKKIIFPNGIPPEDVAPYAPKYSLTRTYSSSSFSCVLIDTVITRKDKEFNGFCGKTLSNYENLSIAYKSEVTDNKSNHNLMKPIVIEVVSQNSNGYTRYGC